MSALDQLTILDYTAEIARIPLVPGHETLPPREFESEITFHFSDVIYKDRSRAAELRRILDEAIYQIRKNWGQKGQPPIYGDGLMYDFVVLSDGTIVRTRRRRVQLWHVRNEQGNAHSWSVHVMLGRGQDVTPEQRRSIFALFDALCADSHIPRASVVAHCEWPVLRGLAVTGAAYHVQPGQSECPCPILWNSIVGPYRAGASVERRMHIIAQCSPDPADNFAAVRIAPMRSAPEAQISGKNVRLSPLTPVIVDSLQNGYYHLAASNPAGGAIGFIAQSLLDAGWPAPSAPQSGAINDLTFAAAPRISVTQFRRVLERAGSPAALLADMLYAIPVAAGLDPAVALAMFGHESSYGTAGICHEYDTKNWGNVRSPVDLRRGVVIPTRNGNFAKYATWGAGLLDWCERIQQRYIIAQGLDTIAKAIPIYAPSSDSNKPAAYIAAIVRAVAQWQSEDRP
jgi:hypothetical protein